MNPSLCSPQIDDVTAKLFFLVFFFLMQDASCSSLDRVDQFQTNVCHPYGAGNIAPSSYALTYTGSASSNTAGQPIVRLSSKAATANMLPEGLISCPRKGPSWLRMVTPPLGHTHVLIVVVTFVPMVCGHGTHREHQLPMCIQRTMLPVPAAVLPSLWSALIRTILSAVLHHRAVLAQLTLVLSRLGLHCLSPITFMVPVLTPLLHRTRNPRTRGPLHSLPRLLKPPQTLEPVLVPSHSQPVPPPKSKSFMVHKMIA